MAKTTEKISLIQKFKNWLDSWTVSTRLFFRAAPLALVLLGLFVGATIFLDHRYAQKITEEKTEMLMDVLMASSTDAIITEDEGVLDVLITQAMLRDERIEKISVSNEEGRVLFENVSADYSKNKRGFIKKKRELNVSGEVFGSLVAEFDFRDLPHQLFVHDLILGGIVFIIWIIMIVFFKIFSKKFFEKPLLRINQRLKFVLGESPQEVPPLTELYELAQIESLLGSLQVLSKQNDEKKQPEVPAPKTEVVSTTTKPQEVVVQAPTEAQAPEPASLPDQEATPEIITSETVPVEKIEEMAKSSPENIPNAPALEKK